MIYFLNKKILKLKTTQKSLKKLEKLIFLKKTLLLFYNGK